MDPKLSNPKQGGGETIGEPHIRPVDINKEQKGGWEDKEPLGGHLNRTEPTDKNKSNESEFRDRIEQEKASLGRDKDQPRTLPERSNLEKGPNIESQEVRDRTQEEENVLGKMKGQSGTC